MITLYADRKTSCDFMGGLSETLLYGPPIGTRIALTKNEYAYSCGEIDQNIYFLESGQLKTVTFSRSGKECFLRICGPGEMFGEQGLGGAVRAESTIAMQDCVIRRVPYSLFINTIRDEGLMEDFITHLSRRLFEQQQAITNLVTVDSEQRLGTILLDLADKLGKGDPHRPRIDLRLTHEELARMVGTTRSRIGHFLKSFRGNGLISTSPTSRLIIHRQRLSAYLNGRYS
ncbi:Crp/Fnr family transcriptional regulator [Streptomyces yaizuensis]|uniref:Crp/Fnr family transcriptional regulator n=1 Tax=Streptomyces yaizuensis TaxID=2989713 RepID=A0ABQ5PAL0_9ACTN|nr:Crp/Fnr family transcriptional regulator [Streptomyces sp. YSPA8]GLF99628.1 Crp/Fnr family transcriptional regulator [Streptomyces sp. YSPA8]